MQTIFKTLAGKFRPKHPKHLAGDVNIAAERDALARQIIYGSVSPGNIISHRSTRIFIEPSGVVRIKYNCGTEITLAVMPKGDMALTCIAAPGQAPVINTNDSVNGPDRSGRCKEPLVKLGQGAYEEVI